LLAVKIIDSARKHGISDVDIQYVYETAGQSIILQEEPEKVMLLGYDTIGRPLEVGYIVNDQDESIMIHAMKVRQGYKKYLESRKGV
jgi:hypothetical protein